MNVGGPNVKKLSQADMAQLVQIAMHLPHHHGPEVYIGKLLDSRYETVIFLTYPLTKLMVLSIVVFFMQKGLRPRPFNSTVPISL